MEHVAILSKESRLLQKIISGEKTIESRWYKHRKAPFRSISAGDVVYFKESGEPVCAKAVVEKAIFHESLTPKDAKAILAEYCDRLGVGMGYLGQVKDKKLCTLVFLRDAEEIAPFEISKKGYGLMSAWITVNDIGQVKKFPSCRGKV